MSSLNVSPCLLWISAECVMSCCTSLVKSASGADKVFICCLIYSSTRSWNSGSFSGAEVSPGSFWDFFTILNVGYCRLLQSRGMCMNYRIELTDLSMRYPIFRVHHIRMEFNLRATVDWFLLTIVTSGIFPERLGFVPKLVSSEEIRLIMKVLMIFFGN